MLNWLIAYLTPVQGGILHSLSAELRAGGVSTIALAFALGAVHALTPGHGKTALAAYFLGRDAPVGKGVRMALTAAMLHVLSGLTIFLVLRLMLGQVPSITSRGSPSFTVLGYGLIVLAGAAMVFQSVRPSRHGHDGAHALTGGIGLLPCPLTILVLGFAWLEGTLLMVSVVLLALAAGIATTIGIVAVATILLRRVLGMAFVHRLPQLDYGTRVLQGLAGTAIVMIGVATLARVVF
jgi:ABC-type nickel/cobalt efflux system permease component RcnA